MSIKQELKEKYLGPELETTLAITPSRYLTAEVRDRIATLKERAAEKLCATFEGNFDTIEGVLSEKISGEDLNNMIRLNFELLYNPTVKTLCGVQPICEPVADVEFLEYVRDDKDSNRLSLDVGTDTVSVKSIPVSDADASTMFSENVSLELFNTLGEHYNEMISHELIELILNRVGLTYEIDVSPSESGIYGDTCNMLIVKIAEAANTSARSTRRGTGNTLWVSPLGLSLLQMSTMSSFMGGYDDHDPRLVGILNGTMKVYVSTDPLLEKKMIVGYVGGSRADAGIIMGQYIPLSIDGDDKLVAQHAFYSPENRMDHYAVINITGNALG